MTASEHHENTAPASFSISTQKAFGWSLGLFVLTVVWVGLTSHDIGYTRDEGYYFKAGRDYFGWFQALSRHFSAGEFLKPFQQATIDRHWSYNHEHPVLVKTLFALSYGFLKEGLHLFSTDGAAMRFVGWCFGGLSVVMTYLLSLKLMPHRFALLSALLWLCMPRSFWHMHLACFDIPVVFAHLWIIHAYLKSHSSWKRALWMGVVLGLAAAIKHNVLFVPFILVLHWLVLQAKTSTADGLHFKLPSIPLAFFAMIFIAPVVFILHWPYLWPDLIDRIQWYLNFHLDHEHYPILYFGELLVSPPFPRAFPFVMSSITIPLVTLSIILIALIVCTKFILQNFKHVRRLAKSEDPAFLLQPMALVTLFLLNGLMPFLLISSPSTPIFGGTKHWLNGIPFLIILGVWAIYRLLFSFAQNARWQWPVIAFLILPALTLTLRAHPYGLSSYNEAIGFARGAANVGFQRTFWGYEPMKNWQLINQRTSPKSKIHLGDTNKASYRTYIKDKIIRKDLRYTHRVKDANVASVQPQGEFKKQWIDVWNLWGIRKPASVVHIDGVPLSTVTFKP
jgi:4-amino-4-deoxy-L-arabinose transferase-like glycosyltransferase